MARELTGRQNGAAIRALRKKDRRGAEDVALQVGLSCGQALRNIENGSLPASKGVIRAIADLLGVPEEAITRDGRSLDEDEDECEPVAEKAA